MRQVWWIVALTGCRQIFGLDDPTGGGPRLDAHLGDGVSLDSSRDGQDTDGQPIDGSPPQGLYVQGASTTGAGSSTVLTYPSAQEPGDLNLVAVTWSGTGSVSGVTDSNGNVYAQNGPTVVGPSGRAQVLYYVPDIAGGGNTVTVAFGTAPTMSVVMIVEYRNLLKSSVIDNNLGFTGTGATVGGSISTSHAHDLIVGIIAADGGSVSADSGCTYRVGYQASAIADREVSSAGSYPCAFTQDQSAAYVLRVIAFAVGP